MSVALVVALVVVGAVAAVVGTAGGITSLVSFPALLLLGFGRHDADVVNLVALVGGLPGTLAASRPERVVLRGRLLPSCIAAAVGQASGSLLLALTPPGAFAALVPGLVVLGCLALALQPRLMSAHGTPDAVGSGRSPLLFVLVAVVSVYGGYFGAGSGVMLLVLALTMLDARMPVANAAKNVMVGVSAVGSTLVLCCTSHVHWAAAIAVGGGQFLGSQIGPHVARRLPAGVLRWSVVVLGLVFALLLALDVV